jgi:hypothetical protein
MEKVNRIVCIMCRFVTIVVVIFSLSNHVVAQTELTWPSPDEEIPSYVLEAREGSVHVYTTPKDDVKLGEIQEMEIYEPEYHVYRAPFRYKNVQMDRWMEYNDKGVELYANGTITISEEKPIVSVTIVGSGCETPNYNIVEWWGKGEDLSNSHGQLVKRSRIDNLKGQHNAWLQKAFTRDRFKEKGFTTLDEANEFMAKLRRVMYAKTSNFYMPGSVMGGLYENTAYFRIGDVNIFSEEDKKEEGEVFREIVGQSDVYKIVVRGGGLDYEDPGSDRERYPAEYAFRLIEVVVKK